MLRYLPGLVLLQLVTLVLFVVNAESEPPALLLSVGLPAAALAAVTALWFRSLSRADGERDLARTRLEHERERERERERLQRSASRERESLVRESERTRRREVRRTTRRAAFQVGLAFAATGAMGVLFVLSELVTLGLLTFATGGGALGGYLLRWRQTRLRVPGAARGGTHPAADATFGPTPTEEAPPAGESPPTRVPRLPSPAEEDAVRRAELSSWRSRF